MKNVFKLIEALNSAKYLQTDEDYTIFLEAFDKLKATPKDEIDQPVLAIRKLFNVFNSETEDFQTLTEVCFFINEFENIIGVNDFMGVLFEEFEKLKFDEMVWIETFITSIIGKTYLESIKSYLPNSDKRIKDAFRVVALEFINDSESKKSTITNSKAIRLPLEIALFKILLRRATQNSEWLFDFQGVRSLKSTICF